MECNLAERGEEHLTEARTDGAIHAVEEGTRNRSPDPRRGIGTLHAITTGERNTVRRVRNMKTGDRREKGSTMM